jgi:hypothetical protein
MTVAARKRRFVLLQSRDSHGADLGTPPALGQRRGKNSLGRFLASRFFLDVFVQRDQFQVLSVKNLIAIYAAEIIDPIPSH